jgi:ABC-type phosphate transport system substrate-binding protein
MLICIEVRRECTGRRCRGVRSVETAIASDAVVFIVYKGNPVKSPTVGRNRKIYTGETINRSQVGGKNEPVKVFKGFINKKLLAVEIIYVF